jgi:hypothetical protein
MQYRVKSQLYADAEAQVKGAANQILDDCTWSSAAAAVSWASGYAVDFTAAQGVAAFEKATGRKDVQGKNDAGGSLAEAVKTIAVLGGKARYAKSWNDAMQAGRGGAALMVWVQQPVGYPDVRISKWHDVWKKWWTKKDPAHLKAGYGHMTSAGWDAVDGWQWACPTRDEKVAAEKYGVPVTEAQLRQIANSKVKAKKVKVDYKCLLIVTHPGRVAAAPQDKPTPVSVPVAAPVVAPVVAPAPAPTIVVQAPPSHAKEAPMPKVTKTAATIADAEAALLRVDWDEKSKEAVSALVAAAKASNGKKGLRSKIAASASWIIANTGIDEMVVEALRTGLGTALALLLATGSQLTKLDADQADMILAGAIAACLQVIVRALNPDDPKFGVGKAKQEIRNGNGLHK